MSIFDNDIMCTTSSMYLCLFEAYINQKIDCKLHSYDNLCTHILHMYLWLCRSILVYHNMQTLQDEIVFFSHDIYVCLKNTYMTCYETYCFQLPGNGNSFSTRKVLIKLEEKHYMYYTRTYHYQDRKTQGMIASWPMKRGLHIHPMHE